MLVKLKDAGCHISEVFECDPEDFPPRKVALSFGIDWQRVV
jgi:hypothetical protein